jgi:hypothetical protein
MLLIQEETMEPHWEPIPEIGLFIAGFRHRIKCKSTAGPPHQLEATR